MTHSLFKDYNKYIILDCREHTEYSVSHLKNSLWVGYTKFNTTNLPKNSKNKKIVVYCTIGWRSEKIGEKLLNMGYTNIHNLKGSILKWNNDGYPLYKNKQKTEQIHSYNKYFSKYVKTGKIIN